MPFVGFKPTISQSVNGDFQPGWTNSNYATCKFAMVTEDQNGDWGIVKAHWAKEIVMLPWLLRVKMETGELSEPTGPKE